MVSNQLIVFLDSLDIVLIFRINRNYSPPQKHFKPIWPPDLYIMDAYYFLMNIPIDREQILNFVLTDPKAATDLILEINLNKPVKSIFLLSTMYKPKLAIIIRSFDVDCQEYEKLKTFFEISYINKSGTRLSEIEVIDALRDADAVLAGTEPFNKNVLKSTDCLKVISRVGVGLDNIDLKMASEHAIKIYNTPNAPTLAVAEHTLALIFSIYKNIVSYNRFNSEKNPKIVSGLLISGKTAGIIGLGRIGFTVAKLLFAVGCKIGFYDPYISGKEIPKEWTQYSSINELLENSDIITLHMPPNPDGTPIISKSSITHFKKGSVLINTARSSLVDENVLLKAIDEGIISAAGLDVYDSIIEDQIQNYPQIIITPHIASNTEESRKDMEKEAIENLISAFSEN